MTKFIHIVIIDYPNALQSAVQGFRELFLLANKVIKDNQLEIQFTVKLIQPDKDLDGMSRHDIVILPPNLDGHYYLSPQPGLLQYLNDAHQKGAILCSACAGAFILAKTGLLDNRVATTHWQLADDFNELFPKVSLEIDCLLVNDGDIISAGGLMSWIDLGLELVALFAKPHIMRTLGKFLIVDTGKREQRYYGSFTPKFNHGNKQILQAQHYIQANYSKTLNVSVLATLACMSERTFLRQFTNATSLKPIQYIQKVRVQKACELLETTPQSFERIALNIGYDDVNSFRKVFIKIIGLSPSAFKARFV
ncbi:transcriptional regulator containing an amidase domain and an AraC-type DNA-binding HTH domain [Shewanella psychrophila]|uniref:Transcriptional regulator containing an amidase domain and an AraC-type DNA-binding HTH domain n=1 Tax=Shewanella psychrophila TaxID=225848 RepID=A0A1S6HUU3_9GAMM|nr:helix-turn-helix domain-containing protein [Shewanella psychrophila]AQS39330.1 transcriptional regulator containing an amidase domain and an AraC-type DNA-binding HTH domain [Shewanella psychrophila]